MRSIFTFVLLVSVGLFITGCKKNREVFPPTAEIYASRVQVGIGTATLQAAFSGFEITERGICWGNGNDPTISGPYVNSGSGDGNVVEVITGLTPGKTYFARAYAVNKGGTTYSEPITFVVDKAPDLITGPAHARSTNSVIINVQVGLFNSAASGTFGICYADHTGPTTADHVTAMVPYPGNFYSHAITGLDPGTTYYARSVVRMPGGTFFGNEVMFNTYAGTVNDVDGNAYFTVKIGSQEWMVSNLRTTTYQDGTSIPAVSASLWSATNTDARGVFQDNEYNAFNYGRYYNRDAVTNLHGLAPVGWRIPSRADWQQLFNYAGVDSAAIRLISDEWYLAGGDNRYGLSVMPTGIRFSTGADQYPLTTGNFWTTSIEGGYYQTIVFGKTYYDYIPYSSANRPGMSVRCVKE